MSVEAMQSDTALISEVPDTPQALHDVPAVGASCPPNASQMRYDRRTGHRVRRLPPSNPKERPSSPLFLPESTDDELDDSSLPRKRRRRRNAAELFFDIEAGEADDDDEDENEGLKDTADFIDDEPNHLFPVDTALPQLESELLSVDTIESREEEARQLEIIAAHYEELARAQDREREDHMSRAREPEDHMFSSGTSGTPETIWDALQAPPVSRLPPENAPPFYVIRTPENFELQLIDYLVDCGIVISAGTIGVGSRVVFVELEYIRIVHKRDDQVDPIVFTPLQVLVGALKHAIISTRWKSPPSGGIVCFCRLANPELLHPFDTPYGRFVRVQSNGLYHSDLGFLADQYSLWIVPRIDYDVVPAPRHQSRRPSQGLFSQAKFRASLPAETLKVYPNQYGFQWGSRFFDLRAGLEVLQSEKLKFTTVKVIPTAAELSLFIDSGAPELDVPFKGYACALQEGDRVVVPEGTSSLVPAYIIRTFERNVNGQRVRFAVLVPEYNGTDTIDSTSPLLKDAYIEPVFRLRLHILSPSRSINVGDRVLVIGGTSVRNLSGRVTELTPGTVSFESFDSGADEAAAAIECQHSIVTVERRHIRLDFRCGDVVRATRGEHAGRIGFIVAVQYGGYVEFYPAELSNRKVKLAIYKDGDATIKIPTANLLFESFDLADFQLGLSGDWAGKSALQVARQSGSELDRHRERMERQMMHTGQWLLGMEVKIIGQHYYKGHFGSIKGWHLADALPVGESTEPPSEGDWEARASVAGRIEFDEIVLNVLLENIPVIQEAAFKQVVERRSGLSLDKSAMMSILGRLMVFEPKEAPPAQPEPDLDPGAALDEYTEAERAFLASAQIQQYGTAPDIGEFNCELHVPPNACEPGESTGRWLLHPNLVEKRIDVTVVPLQDMQKIRVQYRKLDRKINNKTLQQVGTEGYLTPFTKPLTEKDLENETVEFRRIPGVVARIPIPGLRPLPVIGRVLVIGPDVSGSWQRTGEYAETSPSSDFPVGVVKVLFRWDHDAQGRDVRPEGMYHVQCLCRANNQEIMGSSRYTTNFTAKKNSPGWESTGWEPSTEAGEGLGLTSFVSIVVPSFISIVVLKSYSTQHL
ncbi:hypothetical protein GGX14DRAFT_396739 [Mycena pura]|uniref:KOW domain-containing protein n=1 Tax=Mycena pura TaxID=153505 RepID=A0AAD6VAQ5_9AGAR|nr:hypothetical protein GGX14DRAFT_396739 [Mycena pura]